MNLQQLYESKKIVSRVGIYIRLSKEDEQTGESESIANQREYLTKYVASKGWILADIYQDDGYSGTNFERPGFVRLLEDIEAHSVNTVITKDLSRLGRDYIGIGYYLEKYFPQRGVRYIAVNDGIDTFLEQGDDMTPFRAVINDLYAKDISKKVKSVFDTKRRNGEFIGAFAPYGYTKDPKDKNLLVIDEEAAAVVRLIFELFMLGDGYLRISRLLNEKGIQCPAVYKGSNSSYRNAKLKTTGWTHETVRKILNNPTYAGDLAQGKYRKLSYKTKRQLNVPKDNWIIVKDAAPAIIDKASFECAQELIRCKSGYGKKEVQEHLLSGLIYCGDCGGRMTFHSYKSGSYCICSTYRKHGKKLCTGHSINEKLLEEHVLGRLKEMVHDNCDIQALTDIITAKRSTAKQATTYTHTSSTGEMRIDELNTAIKMLYTDRARGLVREDDFLRLYRGYCDERDYYIKKREREELDRNVDKDSVVKSNKDKVESLLDFSEPDKLLVTQLVERITVFETQEEKKVEISYRFLNVLL